VLTDKDQEEAAPGEQSAGPTHVCMVRSNSFIINPSIKAAVAVHHTWHVDWHYARQQQCFSCPTAAVLQVALGRAGAPGAAFTGGWVM
jgi:hypothetical protein